MLSHSVVSNFCNLMDCSPPGSSVHRGFSRQEYWGGLPCPHSRIFPAQGSRSSTLQENPLRSQPPGKPMNTGVDSLSLLQGIFPTQESNQGLLHCRWILYQLSYRGLFLVSMHFRQLGAVWIHLFGTDHSIVFLDT